MNKYQVLGIIDDGAYGTVYKAKNKENDEIVAIKKFKSTDEDEAVKKTSIREVKCLRSIKHDNIIQLKEAFKKKGRLFLVFEYWDKNLLNLLEEHQSGIDPELMKNYLYQLLVAIEYWHRNGVIHRDIKPENVLLNEDTKKLKLCDFGFARSIPSKVGVELTDYVATRWYRSPELLLKTAYGKPADMWAVGWIMGEMADGEALFPGDSEIDQLYQIQKILGRFPDELNEEFSRNPRYLGYKFPDLSKPETLEKRYIGKLSKKALSLMSGLLELLPENRWTAIQALSHPYFDGIRDQETENYLANLKKTGKKVSTKISTKVTSQKEKSVKRNNVKYVSWF